MDASGQEIVPKEIIVMDECIQLLAKRAVFWPAKKTLLVADLHWGKAETFQAYGIPVANTIFFHDLERLTSVIQQTGAERLIILGDLIHHINGLTPALIDHISAWRAALSELDIVLLRGNHDRFLQDLPTNWQMQLVEECLQDGPFVFMHHPYETPNYYTWCGHLHPTVTLHKGRDRLRLLCFNIGSRLGILPAFSELTGGADQRRTAQTRLFAIVEEQIIEV